jgi:N-terminal half of MaoC dehydratase
MASPVKGRANGCAERHRKSVNGYRAERRKGNSIMTTTLLAPGLRKDALAEARAMIGQEFRIEQWNYEASRDVIRHYAWGIGDDNPLWCDPAYAARTRHKGIVAPPTVSSMLWWRRVFPISNGSIQGRIGCSIGRCGSASQSPQEPSSSTPGKSAASRSSA